MKEKRDLFNVSILALVVLVCGLGLTPYAMAHSIGNILMVPSTPAELLDGEPVTVRFSYVTEEPDGVLIHAIPYTKGRPTPGAELSKSQLYFGEGQGSEYFTVLDNDISVDEVKMQMTNWDGSKVYVEFFLNVE